MGPALEVSGLRVSLFTRAGVLAAVDGVSFAVSPGETIALVGESGCGKSLTALSLMRLLPDPPARIVGGTARLDGIDLFRLTEREMQAIRSRRMSMIFQDPASSLNPVVSIGDQIVEVLRAHTDLGRRAAHDRALELLDLVRIADPRSRFGEYPHRLSGGMCQRVMIAVAIACGPQVLIADEPTTALDVTVQAQVLDLLRNLQHESGMAMVFITHDLGVVAEVADRVVVMYAGRKVEEASIDALFSSPLHPYTQGLLAATRTPGMARSTRLSEIPGTVPSLSGMPAGCAFEPRCPVARRRCMTEQPAGTAPAPGRLVACFAVEETQAERCLDVAIERS
jgi:peptide/nickel transport system ATP-binding protein